MSRGFHVPIETCFHKGTSAISAASCAQQCCRCSCSHADSQPTMRFHQLQIIYLLALSCNDVAAFVPRLAPTQQHREQNPSTHDQFGKLQRPKRCIHHHAAAAAAAVTPVMTASGKSYPWHSSSIHSVAAAEALSASDVARATTRGSAIRAPYRGAKDEQRGAISRAALTRSEAVASVASIAMAGTATVAAGLLLRPRRAAAAETAAAEVTPSEAAATTAAVKPGTDTSSPEEAKYAVGSDEVGVLFGDGPIGIKLGDNPLKASGVCRVYVTEVGGICEAVDWKAWPTLPALTGLSFPLASQAALTARLPLVYRYMVQGASLRGRLRSLRKEKYTKLLSISICEADSSGP